eukprot:1187642-Prorocentrum_minimum.AAC.3
MDCSVAQPHLARLFRGRTENMMARVAAGQLSSVTALRGQSARLSSKKALPRRIVAKRSPLQIRSHGLIDLPPTYGLVAFTGAASFVLVQWQAVQVHMHNRPHNILNCNQHVGKETCVIRRVLPALVALARRKYDVKYPKVPDPREVSRISFATMFYRLME